MLDIKEQFDTEIRKKIKNKSQVAVIPVGSIEQHGPHLPLSTDSDIVTEIAKIICKKKKFILFPTISYGVSFEHAPYFNMSIQESTLKKLLSELCQSLLSNGIKTVFIINGHHGNQGALMKIHFTKMRVFTFSYWHFLEREFDHAGFVETSLMLAISNKKVRMSKARKGLITDGMSESERAELGVLAKKSFPSVTKNGIWGDPRKASRSDGFKILSEITKNLGKKCQTCLTDKNPKLHQ